MAVLFLSGQMNTQYEVFLFNGILSFYAVQNNTRNERTIPQGNMRFRFGKTVE
jgi:hypothetical protein